MPEPFVSVPGPVGDAACWLDRVCPACGALDEHHVGDADPTPTCARCGATREEYA